MVDKPAAEQEAREKKVRRCPVRMLNSQRRGPSWEGEGEEGTTHTQGTTRE